jgi:hypothetical protein
LSAEKNDIFGLGVTGICMLFNEVKADDISDITEG